MIILNQLPKYVYFLLVAQAFNLIAAVLSVTVSAIVGLKLAPTQALATIPYGLQFLAILLTTFIFSFLMKKFINLRALARFWKKKLRHKYVFCTWRYQKSSC